MVAPVPAQISKLRHCPTPRSLRIYPLPTTHCPLSSSHPSSASRGVNIPPVLSSFRILPVATGVYPTTDLRIFRDANSFASYHIPATPAVSCNYALFCATARRYPSYSQQLPHSFCRHGGGTPVASVLRPPILCVALFPAVARSVFSATCSLFFSLCSLFANPTLCFQSLADSFSKTPGVGVGSQSRHLESTTSRLFFPKVGSSRCAPCLCGQSSSFQNQPTACMVETSSGMSMRITVPSPVRLSISRRKSVPYNTRSRSRTLLRPMPSTYTCGIFSSEMPTPLSSISMRKRPSRFVVRNWILPPSIFRASPCFKQFSTMGCSNMLGTKASSASSSTLLIISRLSRPNRATSMSR